MSRQPHREKDAKVEGRDPSEKAKGTMETFKALATRLLKVPMEEVEEQQRLYDAEKLKSPALVKRKKIARVIDASQANASKLQPRAGRSKPHLDRP
jgi:hypothetical protein